MNKFLLFVVALGLLFGATARAGEKVFFETDKSSLSFIEKEKVITLAEKAKRDGTVIVIVGNADKRGSRLYNLDLGMRRAQAVFDALVEQGVSESQLVITLSQGEERPLAPADSLKEHLATNRRVDVVTVEAGTNTVIVKVPVEVVRDVPSYRKNRVSLLAGLGPYGLDKKTLGVNHYLVSRDYSAVFGLGYSRSLNSRFSVGLMGFTNNSYFINLGLDF